MGGYGIRCACLAFALYATLGSVVALVVFGLYSWIVVGHYPEPRPSLSPVAIFEEMVRRYPELEAGVRRTLERRIRSWRAIHGQEQEVIFRQVHEPAGWDCRTALGSATDLP